MQKSIYWILAAIAAVFGLGVVLKREKTIEAQAEDVTDAIPAPPEPAQETPTPTPAQVYSTEDGEGLQAITARSQAIDRSSEKQKIIDRIGVNYYAGVPEFKTDLMAAMGMIFGSPTQLPVYAYNLEPSWENFLQTIRDTESFDPMSQGGQAERAKQIWENVLTFSRTGISFWPPNLPQLIEDGYFKASGNADRDRSERYDVFTTGMQAVAKNLQSASSSYTQELRNKAIADLVGAGWKFYGVNG